MPNSVVLKDMDLSQDEDLSQTEFEDYLRVMVKNVLKTEIKNMLSKQKIDTPMYCDSIKT